MKTNLFASPAILITSAFLMQAPAAGSAGTDGAAFLDIPVGAGPAALGSAYTALATDAYAPVWNPAGLGMLTDNEMAAQHLSYLESMHYEFLSFAHPFDSARGSGHHRGIAFSVQYLGSGDINRTDINPQDNSLVDNVGTFSSDFASYNLSYGQSVTDNLALGVTGKMIRAKIEDVTASAYAADVAGLYKVNAKTQLAASLVNLGTRLKFISEADNLPLAFKVGGAYQPGSQYLISADGVFPKTGLANFHIGGQWRPVNMISLRLGYKTDTLKGLSPLSGMTAGVGLHAWGQEFAYAWAPYGDLGDAQYFSLLIHFGARDEQKRNLIQYQEVKRHRHVSEGAMQRNEIEPEYQQLMELLAAEDSHVAQAPVSKRPVER